MDSILETDIDTDSVIIEEKIIDNFVGIGLPSFAIN